MKAGACPRLLFALSFFSLLLSPGFVLKAEPDAPVLDVACPSCDDFNPCTVDTCDVTTGTCRHDPLSCDDGNSCTLDSCDATHHVTGGCVHVNLPDGSTCSDNNSCTAGDACVPTPGSASQCAGQILPAGQVCQDGNSCTSGDSCTEGGQCVGSPLTPGSPCDDQSLCTPDDICVTSTGGSILCQGTAKDCSDGMPCTQDLCNPATGQCNNPPLSCDDGNACTGDACDAGTGACVRTFLPGSCSDGNFCTSGDQCSSGNCVGGAPTSCEDNAYCSRDSCSSDLGQCIHQPFDDLCRPDTICVTYVCDNIGGPPPEHEDGCTPRPRPGPFECDGNPCTTDGCDTQTGACFFAFYNTNPCDDHNVCTTNDRCSSGSCGGTPSCDDGNVCTNDSCDPETGACQHANNTEPCGDGNPCTAGDVCSGGICQSGTPLSCDDGDPCTADSCTGTGCAHTAACDDGNACTTDSCDAGTGACQHTNNTGSCSDGNPCTLADACSAGACQGTPMNCDDGNVCTNDQCEVGICRHYDTFLPPCDDLNPCTVNDHCSNGACTGSPRVCNDFVQCTDGSCDPAVGCIYTPNSTDFCTDFNACTVGDRCSNGTCQSGTPNDCDDHNVCTTDSCAPATGACQRVNNTDPCEEGNLCTIGDLCSGGVCQSGAALNCDDGNLCTPDHCDQGICTHDPGTPSEPPTLSVALAPSILTPMNHKMVAIVATIVAHDSCGSPLSPLLVSIVSSEPDDAPGQTDGHTLNDIQGAEIGTTDLQFQLRAERDSSGSGRIYTVTYAVTDSVGQTQSASGIVSVPVRRNSPTPLSGTNPRPKKEPK